MDLAFRKPTHHHTNRMSPTLPPLPPVPATGDKTVAQIEQLPRADEEAAEIVEQVVVGQNATVEAILIALITRGHCLLTGVPGLAKTLLVKVVAHLLGLHFSRVQFTPDLIAVGYHRDRYS